MSNNPYLLVILGDRSHCDQIRDAVLEAAEDQLKLPLVEVVDTLPTLADPAARGPYVVVVVAFSGPDSIDRHVRAQVERALTDLVPVLPVRCGDADLATLTPALSKLNAVDWNERLHSVQAILSLLGLAEAERRVFLSYKRSDSEPLAFQLRYALQDRGFDVFLDRYAIPPAVDFQERLDAELGDKAFVVLLEGPTTHASKWVMHEVLYALRQHVALVALTMPGVTAPRRVSEIPDANRVELDASMMTANGEFTSAALEVVLRHLEWQYALRLRRHREQLIDSLGDWLRASSHKVVAMPGWTLVAEDGPHAGVYLITPRAPTPADLRNADLTRAQVNAALPAIVAHNPERIEESKLEVIRWIIGRGGDLHAEHHAGLGLLLGASAGKP